LKFQYLPKILPDNFCKGLKKHCGPLLREIDMNISSNKIGKYPLINNAWLSDATKQTYALALATG
jgi:hypothetical protein